MAERYLLYVTKEGERKATRRMSMNEYLFRRLVEALFWIGVGLLIYHFRQ